MVHGLAPPAGLAPPSGLAPPTLLQPPPATGVQSIPLLDGVAAAAVECLAVEQVNGRERDGSWCVDEQKDDLLRALRGLRGRKLAWWLDAPRALCAHYIRGPRLDISVIALPGGSSLLQDPYPAGAVILVEPLLGQVEVRRVRQQDRQELMRKTLRAEDETFSLAGGAMHEWVGTAGVASAFLQVVLLPPSSRFPGEAENDEAMRLLREGDSEPEAASVSPIGVAISDLVQIDRPPPGGWEMQAGSSGALPVNDMPEDAPELLARLGTKVGGLDGPISTIVRRALASRLYPRALTKELGVSPVRGMLLYGPPGCGKTLLAREICGALGAREPKIVNGPEMMSKFVGDSEQFIRALFAEAELEQAEAGDASALHVVVFDEMDAFTRERGSLSGDTSGIRDSVVNQLLAIMDGVNQLDNILVVGLTNRPELIDSALLRPGRLEVQVQVPRPDAAGRQQILAIQTRRLRERGCLAPRAATALASGALAAVTKGFSGADLAGLTRSATSFALERYVDDALLDGWQPGAAKSTDAEVVEGSLEVGYDDLVRALREASPKPSYARRAKTVGSKGGQQQGGERAVRQQLRGWWRERQLGLLTDRAVAAGGAEGAIFARNRK